MSCRTRFNFTAVSWTDVDAALPLQYKFLTYTTDAAVDGTPLCDYSSTAALTGQLMQLPSSGSSVWVTVVVRNSLGSETMLQPGVQLTITAPTMADLMSQLSSSSSSVMVDTNSSTTGSADNTTLGGNMTVLTTVAALQQAQAAIAASLSAASGGDVSTGGSSTGGGGSSGGTVNIASVMDTMALTVMVLQVTACASVQCGAGVCVISDGTPVCNCSGTGYTGAFCSIAVAVTGSSSSASPSPSTLAAATPTWAAVPQKSCPSVSAVDCSGHGTCLRSQTDCPATSLQCVTACR